MHSLTIWTLCTVYCSPGLGKQYGVLFVEQSHAACFLNDLSLAVLPSMFVILWTLHVPASASPDPADGGGDSRRFLPPSGSAAATAAERGPRATATLRVTPAQLVDGRPVGSRREVTLTIAEHGTGVGGGCRCYRHIPGRRHSFRFHAALFVIAGLQQ